MDRRLRRSRGTAERGFTLVELLVAVAILAVLALGAGLVRARAPDADAAAATLARAFELARRSAVAAQRPTGLEVTEAGLQVVALSAEGVWMATGPEHHLRARPRVRALGPGAPAAGPAVRFLPTGETSAVAIQLGGLSCRATGWSGLACR